MMQSRRAVDGLRGLVALIGLTLAVPVLAQLPCLDSAAELLPGGRTTVEVGGLTWVLLDVQVDVVYRIGIDGAPGTRFELWVLDVDAARDCHIAGERTYDGELIGAPFGFEWTALDVMQAGLRLEPPAGETVEATVRLDAVAAPPGDTVLVIPAVAHIQGVGGTLFRTDVVLFNPLGVPVTARLVLVPTGGEPEQVAEVELATWEVIALDDVVASLFGRLDAKGALRIEAPPSHRLHALSRTYAETEDGSFGQLIPAVA